MCRKPQAATANHLVVISPSIFKAGFFLQGEASVSWAVSAFHLPRTQEGRREPAESRVQEQQQQYSSSRVEVLLRATAVSYTVTVLYVWCILVRESSAQECVTFDITDHIARRL